MHRHTPLTAPAFSLRHVLGALFLGFLCSFLNPHIPAANAAEVVDRIVAVVNDEIIVLQEVNSLVQVLKERLETSGYSEEEKARILENARETYINEQVNQKLIVQAARENEYIEVSEEEIDTEIKDIEAQNNFTEEQFKEALAQDGLTLEDYRAKVEEQILYQNIVYFDVTSKIVITKADVTQYYNEHPEKYKGKATYHVRNIQVNAPTSESAAAKAAVQDKLASIFAELEAGQPFEAVARKYSESATASEGGEFSNKLDPKDLSESFRNAIEPLSPGEYTQAIETSIGYQIFYVEDINKEPDVPLDSVYSEIEEELKNQQYQEKLQAWIKELRENAHIKILQ